MKKIVIIGNSAAGIAAAESIRERDKEAQVTIISEEPFLAYRRDRILTFLESKIKERDLSYRNADFYKNNALDILLEKEVVELNLNRNKVIFKDGEFVNFDGLLIASGAKAVLPKLPGIQREGVVALNGLADVKYIIDNLPIAHTVIVVGSGQIAEEVSRIIASKKIDVKFVGSTAQVTGGIDVISDNSILEILGDSQVKAIRLTSQKVIGASLVIFPRAGHPNIDFVKDTEIKINHGIIVDQEMRTNIPYVLAAGDVAEPADHEKKCGWESVRAEGEMAGKTLVVSI